MFIVPFFTTSAPKSLIAWSVQPITLFLDTRGRSLCQTDSPKEWLENNGFVARKTWSQKTKEGHFYFEEVDNEKTALAEFYTFEDLTVSQQKGTEECWRTFYLLNTTSGDEKSTHHWNDCIEDIFQGPLSVIKSRSKD